MKYILILVVILVTISCKQEESKNTVAIEAAPKAVEQEVAKVKVENFTKNYIGTIGNGMEVVFTLSLNDGRISGSYFYQKVGIDIPLVGKMENDNLVLFELDSKKRKVAKMECKWTQNKISGTWENLDSQKELKLILTETDQLIPNLPKNVEGTYTNTSETACSFKLSISKQENSYFYNILTAERALKGKVSFVRNIDAREVYIKFNGIKWAEYNGAAKDEGEAEKFAIKIPIGIEGVLNENEITIQNYGNSMNNYTKFDDCEDKYIVLRK